MIKLTGIQKDFLLVLLGAVSFSLMVKWIAGV